MAMTELNPESQALSAGCFTFGGIGSDGTVVLRDEVGQLHVSDVVTVAANGELMDSLSPRANFLIGMQWQDIRRDRAPLLPRGDLGLADGQALAVQMLRELEEHDLDYSPYSLDSSEREQGRPQVNIVMKYLDALRDGSRNVEAGFAAVLSDFLAAAGEGGIRDAAWYDERLAAGALDPALPGTRSREDGAEE